MNPLTALSPEDLRSRRSVKWRAYDPDVLPLWVAEMDTPLAPPVAEALTAAVRRGDTGYAHPGGLTEAYAAFSACRFGWAPDPARGRLVPDVMRGVVEVLRVVTAPGDAVVVNPPVYHLFYAAVPQAGCEIAEVPLRVGPDGAYDLDLAGLEAAFARERVTAYLLCSPHNPTGTVFGQDTLRAVAGLAARYGVRVLADEIHAPLTYPGARAVPFLSLADSGGAAAEGAARAFAFTSASKTWNLPGLKAALMFAGPAAAQELGRVPPEVSVGAGLFGVIAAEAALRHGGEWLDALLDGLAANRGLLGRLLAEQLPEVGYRSPDATYLAWLDCRALGLGDDPAAVFLERGRVALSAGPVFGAPGRGFARLNFATTPDLLVEGVERMARAVGR